MNEIRCAVCKKLLGRMNAGNVLTVKYKDLTIWLKGEVTISCPACGSINSINTCRQDVESLVNEE